MYLTISWPSVKEFYKILDTVTGCVDFIELGLPSNNPMYDGPVVKATHRDVVKSGVSPRKALDIVRAAEVDVPVIFMGYLSEHLNSIDLLLESIKKAGGLSILFPDLAFEYPEYLEEYYRLSHRFGLKPSYFASSMFPHRLLRRYAEMDPLLIYLGLQMATGVRLPARMLDNVRLARRIVGDSYLLAGFSIKTGEDAARIIKSGASGVVVGSHIIKAYIRDGIDGVADVACSIKSAIRRLE